MLQREKFTTKSKEGKTNYIHRIISNEITSIKLSGLANPSLVNAKSIKAHSIVYKHHRSSHILSIYTNTSLSHFVAEQKH